MRPEIFDDPHWQMSWGERAAVEGVLSLLRPALALEIGSMEGACLRRIAHHSAEVHSFDLHPPTLEQPDNVILHTGDSHELLPPFLAELADAGRNVDFVIVDGDHTPEGVRQDLEDLLDSPAVARAVILIHDTANERVRAGVDAVRFAAWPKVSHVELDWVPGYLFAEPALRNELWYGLGLVMVDAAHSAYLGGDVYERRYHPSAPILARARQRMRLAQEGADEDHQALLDRLDSMREELGAARRREAALQEELQEAITGLTYQVSGARQAVEDITASASWRLTQPLRVVKRRVRRGGDG